MCSQNPRVCGAGAVMFFTDDAWPNHLTHSFAGMRTRSSRPRHHHLWTRTLFLLCAAHPADSRPRAHRLQNSSGMRQPLALHQLSHGQSQAARRLCLEPSASLSGMGHRHRDFVFLPKSSAQAKNLCQSGVLVADAKASSKGANLCSGCRSTRLFGWGECEQRNPDNCQRRYIAQQMSVFARVVQYLDRHNGSVNQT